MSSSCIEQISSQHNQWYRIVHELLSKADITINGSRPWDIEIKHPRLYKHVIQEGSLGLGESYMAGWWECERPDMFFHRVLKVHLDKQLPRHFRDILRVISARLINFQSRRRAWIVGKKHYDLGNDLFKLMLDPYMQYSCGYWKNARNLEQAQYNKLRMICEKLQLKPGMHLLDIGCGWGGLVEFAARHYGVKVTGITTSTEQQQLALQRCQNLDVDIVLQDYRDLNQQFDRIVSVGMFEHVGPKNYPVFFKTIERNLKPAGIFLLHTIGSNKTDANVDPWINKYIFPNGCLPSVRHIANAAEPYFIMEDWHNFGSDYDLTLMAWNQRFLETWPLLEQKYGQHFKRMFTYYLTCCAGAFRARDLQLWQIVFTRGIRGWPENSPLNKPEPSHEQRNRHMIKVILMVPLTRMKK